MLAAPAAQAFTLGGEAAKAATDNYEVPKFDLEEQAKNFRSGGSASTTPGKTDFNTPLGKAPCSSACSRARPRRSGLGQASAPVAGSRVNRMDFERMVTPENLRWKRRVRR